MHANVWRVISGVSETIRGIPLAEDQTALGKLETRAVERRYSVPLPKFCEKKLLLHAKFLSNRPVGCWVIAKNDFQYGGRPSFWILKIFVFGHVTVMELQIKIRWFVGEILWRLAIFKMADLRFLEF